VSFSIGAVIPLMPWFFGHGDGAVIASVVLGVVAAIIVGLLLSKFTGRSPVRSALRFIALATLAAGVTYLVGRAVGVKSAT
jgi:VIT1/CCC1 family predicted Fe2+/Mn2+ transporter